MPTSLSLDERETAIVQSAQDRKDGIWNVFSDDPYWMKRFDKVATKVRADGNGAWYTLAQRQITLRAPSTPSKHRSTRQSVTSESIVG